MVSNASTMLCPRTAERIFVVGGTWLCLYEDRSERLLFAGIEDRLDRDWEKHRADAEAVRDAAHGYQPLQTEEPFSPRVDALKAEAIAIHVAKFPGVAVYYAEDGVSVNGRKVRVTITVQASETYQSLGLP